MKANIWYSESDYVGATGIDTVTEMAELAIRDRDIVDVLGIDEWPTTVEAIERVLNELGVKAVAVNAAIFRDEVWENTRDIPLDGRPGRGHVKVLGVHL